MKLSELSKASGIEGDIRSTATGEVIHFHIHPKASKPRAHVRVRMHDKHFDGYITFSTIPVEPGDDVDIQLVLQVPMGPSGLEALDHKQPSPPLEPGGRYDVDGAQTRSTGEIKEEDTPLVREPIMTKEDRERHRLEDEGAAGKAEEKLEVDGAPSVSEVQPDPPAGSPPEERDATAVPPHPDPARAEAKGGRRRR